MRFSMQYEIVLVWTHGDWQAQKKTWGTCLASRRYRISCWLICVTLAYVPLVPNAISGGISRRDLRIVGQSMSIPTTARCGCAGMTGTSGTKVSPCLRRAVHWHPYDLSILHMAGSLRCGTRSTASADTGTGAATK